MYRSILLLVVTLWATSHGLTLARAPYAPRCGCKTPIIEPCGYPLTSYAPVIKAAPCSAFELGLEYVELACPGCQECIDTAIPMRGEGCGYCGAGYELGSCNCGLSSCNCGDSSCNCGLSSCNCGLSSCNSRSSCNCGLPTCGLSSCGCGLPACSPITTVVPACNSVTTVAPACNPVVSLAPSYLNSLVVPATSCGCGCVSTLGCLTPPVAPTLGCGKFLRQVTVQPPFL